MKSKIINSVYSRKPLRHHGTIPVFSESNEYIDNYEKISSDHLEHFQKTGHNPFIEEALWKQCEQSTIDLIKTYSNDNDKILDAGVGMGRLLSHFPYLKRYGFDISFGYLELSQKKGIEVCYTLVEELPYKQEYFDVVVCTDMLEHVLDLNLSVRNLLNVLKKSGILIVRVPYRENLYSYLPEVCPYKYVHVRNFDENSLKLLFERIFECKVVEITYAGYYPAMGRLKWSLPFFVGHSIWRQILTKIQKYAPILHRKIIEYLYYPIEMNFVIKK
ncbi:class I SAM-dependent methyltransferase [bacterium]|nr:class I SAM-dependent methyltransferase [bacterium]